MTTMQNTHFWYSSNSLLTAELSFFPMTKCRAVRKPSTRVANFCQLTFSSNVPTRISTSARMQPSAFLPLQINCSYQPEHFDTVYN